MMSKILCLILVLYSVLTVAQQKKEPENGIYLSDSDFLRRKLSFPFTKNENPGTLFRNPLGHYHELWLKTPDSTYIFFNDEIWGYRQHNTDYRLYKNDPYNIEYSGKIFIYTVPSTPGNGTGSTIFFSKDANSPVHDLNKKRLLEAYHLDSSFVQRIKQMKWNESIYKWNKKSQCYEFINWIK